MTHRLTSALLLGTPLLLHALLLPVSGQSAMLLPGVQKSVESITPEALKKTLEFLASDAMKGRDTGSPELLRASTWLAEQAKKAGLQPAFGDAGGAPAGPQRSFFQGERPGDHAQARGVLSTPTGQRRLEAADFVGAGAGATDFEPCSLVFFKGPWSRNSEERAALVKDKVVMIEGPPPAEASRFSRRLRLRARRLREEGARALVVRTYADLPVTSLPLPAIRMKPSELGDALPSNNGPLPDFTVSMQIPAAKVAKSRNVGALLPGSDPELKHEIIVFSAHYDHIGVGRPKDGDSINNGADDNATGSASVLAIAEAMAKLPTAPKRTTLFLWFYGEEKGMLGSRYYCSRPALPLKHHKAVFNIEMVGRPDDIEPDTAWVTGWRVSDFGTILERTAVLSGIRFYEHKRNSRMLFGASDNISFAIKGVPAHSISAGSLHPDYHQPSDEIAKIDFNNMASVVRGIFIAGHTMSDGGPLPTWADGTRYADRHKELQGK